MIPRRFFWLFDLVVVVAAFAGAYLAVPALRLVVNQNSPLGRWLSLLSPPVMWESYLPTPLEMGWIPLLMIGAVILFLEALGSYHRLVDQSYPRIIISSLLAPLFGLGAIAMALFTFKQEEISRLLVFSFALLSGIGFCLYRVTLRRYFLTRRVAGYYAKQSILIGTATGVAWLAHYLKSSRVAIEYKVPGYLLPPDEQATDLDGLSHLGSITDLTAVLAHYPIHEVFVVYPIANDDWIRQHTRLLIVQPVEGGEWIKQVIEDCDTMGVVLRIIPEALLVTDQRMLPTLYPREHLHLPALVIAPPHWDSDALFLKRMFDIVTSTLLLLILAPLFAAIALVIKLMTPKLPIIYPWRVLGHKGVEFISYKFTTTQQGQVTALGRVLRRYGLDELPQLVNVLRGEMSLVGPRPAGFHEPPRYEFWQRRKLSVRPGMTCLWQVYAPRSGGSYDDWVRMDLEYIDSWSLWLDIKILVRTAWKMLAGAGV